MLRGLAQPQEARLYLDKIVRGPVLIRKGFAKEIDELVGGKYGFYIVVAHACLIGGLFRNHQSEERA